MKLPTILTRFSISIGDIDPTICTSYTGLKPTRVLKKGQSRTHPRPPVRESSWEIEGEKRNIYSLDESMEQLLGIIWPAKDKIVSFCREHGLGCIFVSIVWAEGAKRPVYDFSQGTLAGMAALKASWIMDLV